MMVIIAKRNSEAFALLAMDEQDNWRGPEHGWSHTSLSLGHTPYGRSRVGKEEVKWLA